MMSSEAKQQKDGYNLSSTFREGSLAITTSEQRQKKEKEKKEKKKKKKK
jgi:hypothetical protein